MHRVEVRDFISIRSLYRPTPRIENEDSAWFDARFRVVLFDFKDQLGVGLPSQRVEEPMPAPIVPPLFQHALEVGVHDENRRWEKLDNKQVRVATSVVVINRDVRWLRWPQHINASVEGQQVYAAANAAATNPPREQQMRTGPLRVLPFQTPLSVWAGARGRFAGEGAFGLCRRRYGEQ